MPDQTHVTRESDGKDSSHKWHPAVSSMSSRPPVRLWFRKLRRQIPGDTSETAQTETSSYAQIAQRDRLEHTSKRN
eukprot:5696489-Pyramimonas_sp.AAC.1